MAIELYDALYGSSARTRLRSKSNPIEAAQVGYPIIEDAKQITLAQFDRVSKNAITAHRIADYRRKSFNMLLVPEITTWFDLLLGGNEYYAKLLSVKSPYS